MSRARPMLLACAASYFNHIINNKEMRSLCLGNNQQRQLLPRNESHLAGNICFTASFLAFLQKFWFIFASQSTKFLPANNLTWHSYCEAPEITLNLVCRIVYRVMSVDVSVVVYSAAYEKMFRQRSVWNTGHMREAGTILPFRAVLRQRQWQRSTSRG